MIYINYEDESYKIPFINDSSSEKYDWLILDEDIKVELINHNILFIPKYFPSDFHSIPQVLQCILPAFNNKTNIAALVHDFLYEYWELYDIIYKDIPDDLARKYSDICYLDLMNRFSPNTKIKNKIYYYGVRLFGIFNWRKFRKENMTYI